MIVIKNRDFLMLWLSEAFSQIAMNMMNFILILTIFSLTSSNKAVSGLILSFTIPAVIFGILAGALVDNWNKKMVLFLTNIIRFAFIFILSFFYKNIFAFYVFSFLSSIVTQFFIPAETPMIPLLVKKEHLLSANALFGLAWFGSLLIAYALSGPFLLLFGVKNSFFILSFIFLIASVFALMIKKNNSNSNLKLIKFNLYNEIKNTISSIIKIPEVYHAFLLLVLIQVLILIISVLGPGYARSVLKININEFPIIFLTPAVLGMAFGSFTVSNFLNRFSRHKIATLGLFIASFSIISMPYIVNFNLLSFISLLMLGFLKFYQIQFILTVFIAFVLGFSNSLIFVPSNTLIQEHSSNQIRGKIYGALNSASSLLSIIPVSLAGWLADIFGVQLSLIVLGISIFIIGISRLAL